MTETQATIQLRALFADLQRRQDEHDEQFHREIARLPVKERLVHMGLHLLKYAGGFHRGLRGEPALFEKSLVDAFIIVTSSANVLSMLVLEEIARLDESVNRYLDSPTTNVAGLAEVLSKASTPRNSAESAELCVSDFIQAAGDFAKALESLDHLEDIEAPRFMRVALARMASALLRCSKTQRLDLVEKIRLRLNGVRENSFTRRRLGMCDGLLER
jgi:hypothetical protein